MNLTVAQARELPFAAALFSGDELLAATPEWTGAGPGAVTYPVRGSRLVVSTQAGPDTCVPLVSRLLDEVARVAASVPRVQSLRARMLADSLCIVAGRHVAGAGSSSDVLEHACAGIASRTALRVGVDECDDVRVAAPSVAALALVQLAVNAEAHEGAQMVGLSARHGCFTVAWSGHDDARRGPATTARRRADRARWGLGFARIAADAIGARLFPPTGESCARSAILETGLHHLALPLALLRDGVVVKATRAWDEETSLLPGSPVPAGSRAARCVERAAAVPGTLVVTEGWSSRRSARCGTWVAVPPDGVMDRAHDVLDGIAHERALWAGAPEPARSRIVALAAIVTALLGGELDRVPGSAWNERAREVASTYGLTMPVPHFDGTGAVDPRVALFLAEEFGERLETDGDDLYLRIAARHRHDPLVRVLIAAGEDSLKLS